MNDSNISNLDTESENYKRSPGKNLFEKHNISLKNINKKINNKDILNKEEEDFSKFKKNSKKNLLEEEEYEITPNIVININNNIINNIHPFESKINSNKQNLLNQQKKIEDFTLDLKYIKFNRLFNSRYWKIIYIVNIVLSAFLTLFEILILPLKYGKFI